MTIEPSERRVQGALFYNSAPVASLAWAHLGRPSAPPPVGDGPDQVPDGGVPAGPGKPAAYLKLISLESPTSSFLKPPRITAFAPIKLDSKSASVTVAPSEITESRTTEE